MRSHHSSQWDFKLFRNIVVIWWWYHKNELQLWVKNMRKEKWKFSVLQMFVKEIRVEKLRWRVCTFVTFANYGCDIFASLDLGSCHGQQCHLHLFCPHPHLILILILILIPKTWWWWCWSGPHTQLHMVLGHILSRLTTWSVCQTTWDFMTDHSAGQLKIQQGLALYDWFHSEIWIKS